MKGEKHQKLPWSNNLQKTEKWFYFSKIVVKKLEKQEKKQKKQHKKSQNFQKSESKLKLKRKKLKK